MSGDSESPLSLLQGNNNIICGILTFAGYPVRLPCNCCKPSHTILLEKKAIVECHQQGASFEILFGEVPSTPLMVEWGVPCHTRSGGSFRSRGLTSKGKVQYENCKNKGHEYYETSSKSWAGVTAKNRKRPSREKWWGTYGFQYVRCSEEGIYDWYDGWESLVKYEISLEDPAPPKKLWPTLVLKCHKASIENYMFGACDCTLEAVFERKETHEFTSFYAPLLFNLIQQQKKKMSLTEK